MFEPIPVTDRVESCSFGLLRPSGENENKSQVMLDGFKAHLFIKGPTDQWPLKETAVHLLLVSTSPILFFQIPTNEIFVEVNSKEDTFNDIQDEKYLIRSASRRRAKSINPTSTRQILQAVNNVSSNKRRNNELVPTVFKYHFKKSDKEATTAHPSSVYLAGSMMDWKSREMGVLKDESYFISVIGKYNCVMEFSSSAGKTPD